jgi:hypothetical protein
MQGMKTIPNKSSYMYQGTDEIKTLKGTVGLKTSSVFYSPIKLKTHIVISIPNMCLGQRRLKQLKEQLGPKKVQYFTSPIK